MALLQAVNIEENFWTLNPEIKYMSPFIDVFKSSEDQEETSKLMWALYLYTDPDSRFYRMETTDRIKEIGENFYSIKNLNEFKELSKQYEDKLLTKLQRSYNRLLNKLEERDRFISKTTYNEKNAKTLDQMFANSSQIYQQLQAIGDELNAEKKAGSIRGGRKESLTERGII